MSSNLDPLHEAFEVLHASITEAAISGRTSTKTIQITYPDLAKTIGRLASEEHADSSLIVEITTAWGDEDSDIGEDLDG